jgi:hypothetical protein
VFFRKPASEPRRTGGGKHALAREISLSVTGSDVTAGIFPLYSLSFLLSGFSLRSGRNNAWHAAVRARNLSGVFTHQPPSHQIHRRHHTTNINYFA